MTSAADLAELLAAGERAAFHGAPSTAIEPLQRAMVAAIEADRLAEATAATWLLGVALGAAGRYGPALDVLTPLVDGETAIEAPEMRLFAGLAFATVGSVHRQLGRHLSGRDADARGLDLVRDFGAAALEAQVDCAVGLAADAIGLNEEAEAVRWLAEAERFAAARSETAWRPLVRIAWVRAELAMLREDTPTAVTALDEAISRAERARAPRHVAKSLLFQGVAQAQSGDGLSAHTLRRAATLAESLGALPLVWPARAVLGAVLSVAGDPESQAESDRSLAAARSAVVAIAGHLTDDLRDEWLTRPDVAALLGSE